MPKGRSLGRRSVPGPFRRFSPLRFLVGLFSLMASAHSLQATAAAPVLSVSGTCRNTDPLSGYRRMGEAANPGPGGSFVLSTSNPSGLRGKEPQISFLEPGIWSFSETQLSDVSFRATKAALLRQTAAQSRLVRVHGGAPVPLRSNSLWAGGWSGVLQMSDFPCRPLQWSWPADLWISSRVLAVQHYVGSTALTVVSIYGYPQGPTWPDARARTNALLTAVGQELLHGVKGPRIVLGDFNHAIEDLEQCSLWSSLGWQDLQTFAATLWQREPVPTCKHSTFRDFIWASPEVLPWLAKVETRDIFQEHTTVLAHLRCPQSSVPAYVWPMPAEIPWADVCVSAWHSSCDHVPIEHCGSTQWFASFSKSVERSLQGFLPAAPGKSLPSQCFGRGVRTAPQPWAPPRPPRPSREGEVTMRHDGLGMEVQRWFKQLRRWQSLEHAVLANSSAPTAVEYRALLWHAIVAAKGFKGGFTHWWTRRPIQLVGSPASLPDALPGPILIQRMHADFKANYRKLEHWHMQQRSRIMRDRHAESMQQLFLELRDPRPEQVDTLTIHREYAILACEPAGQQLHVESTPDLRGVSTWSVDGLPVRLHSVDDETCTVRDAFLTGDEQLLEQEQTLVSSEDVQLEFIKLWSARWQRHASVSPDMWDRVTNFARAFLPSLSLCLPPLTLDTWYRAVKRFKVRAARGPCGWARADLLHLPRARTTELLHLLARVERSEQPWPQQMLVGLVCSLLKPGGRTDAQAYRPIVLFSIIYRCWAGIRSRQMLQALKQHLPIDLLGFVPQKEASEFWFGVQLQIELCCQASTELYGFATDLVKAFNLLPRDPVFAIASHLGLPATLLDPWRLFLGSVTRRFMVRHTVSAPVQSCTGFPEGCPLSPLAMLITDFSYHCYLREFTPQVRCISFVDNWGCTASSLFGIAAGLSATCCFSDMMDVQLDHDKTYLWVNQASKRPALKHLGPRVVTEIKELGGAMSFGGAIRNKPLVVRCQALEPLWKALRRSTAPLRLKFQALRLKFWPKALHGISACPLGAQHIHSLRMSAVTALQIRPGGSSALLRLALAPNLESDPGFYQLWVTMRDFRRLAGRIPDFLQHWRAFMARFDGRFFHGPCSKLLQVVNEVRWTLLTPPLFEDHDGLQHDLLQCPLSLLRRLAENAWLSLVARRHVHRPSMADLHGLDMGLLRADHARLSALDSARLCALRSGAFTCASQQAKFDLTKDGNCTVCGVPDTPEHQICHCPRFSSLRAPFQWVCDRWHDLPRCFTHHLLPPANPFLPALRRALQDLGDCSGIFQTAPSAGTAQHLFTDGSCTTPECEDYALASWGVILANSQAPVACGQLPGILQTAPRAELMAAISAAKWVHKYQQKTFVWIDALHVVQGIRAIRAGKFDNRWENQDLWQILDGLLEGLDDQRFVVNHTPGHLDTALTESPTEDWLAINNSHADSLAGLANANRTVEFWQLHGQALNYYHGKLAEGRALRQIYFGIADCKLSEGPSKSDEEPLPESTMIPLSREAMDCISDCTPVNWRPRLAAQVTNLPTTFLQAIFQFILQQDSASATLYNIAWLEFVFMLHLSGGFNYPVRVADGSLQDPSHVIFAPTQPTVAVRLGLVRRAAKMIFAGLSLEGFAIRGIDCASLGVRFPLDGYIGGCDVDLLARARSMLSDFVLGRRATGQGVLARPL